MIKLRNIDKYVDKIFQRTFILKSIDLDIVEGEFINLMGASGAGKSTLLNILGFQEEPLEGEYYFLDEPVHEHRRRKNRSFTAPTSDLYSRPTIC